MTCEIVRQLLAHPKPRSIIKALEQALAKEDIARQSFREWVQPDVKAEFINGEIIVHLPSKRRHNRAVMSISVLLGTFSDEHNSGEIAIEKAMIGLERYDVEPDISFWKAKTAAGFTDEMDIYPAPDLVVEILSNSTRHRDRGVKKDAYEGDGVLEYWIVDAQARTVEQYFLREDKRGKLAYVLANLGEDDTITSQAVEGFTCPVIAFFDVKARRQFLLGDA